MLQLGTRHSVLPCVVCRTTPTVCLTGNIITYADNTILASTYDGYASIGFVKKYGLYSRLMYHNATPFIISMASQADLTSNIGGMAYTDRLVIDNSGNVGIGTTTPSKALEVKMG